MSINVTVNGNPISIRRGKMVLSDLDNIKKTDREHRKRLRLEQVNEQSRALSKRLLERVRRIQQEEVDRLQQDENSEIRKAHNQKLMETYHKYRDVDNIGYAHENAAKQPNVECIKQAEKQKYKALAKARGKDAMEKLQETSKIISPHSKKQERLNEVRELENKRSRMVASLPTKTYAPVSVETSDNEDIPKPSSSISRKKIKGVSKISPIKKVKQTKDTSKCTKASSHINVSINSKEFEKLPKPTTSSKVSDAVPQGSKVIESDDNEPRKIAPVISTISRKPEELQKFNKIAYENNSSTELSSISTTSCSSRSDDSSYFSDTPTKTTAIKKISRHPTPTTSSKVTLYDHNTRHRNTYDRPSGLVERINIRNTPSANELAQEIMELEHRESDKLVNQKENLKQRSQDAILREKINKNYQALVKTIYQLSKEKKRIEANQIQNTRLVPPPCKKNEQIARQQKKMDRAFQNILRTTCDTAPNSENLVERAITITPRDYMHSGTSPINTWKEPPCSDNQETDGSISEGDSEYTHKKKISEMLIKIERLKKILLQEYGADLPNEVFNASIKSLFNEMPTTINQEKVQRDSEIQVINMSGCEPSANAARKIVNKAKKISKGSSKVSSKPSITSSISKRDQQIQVELEEDKSKDGIVKNPLEPIVKIITPQNADSSTSFSSNSSVATDLVIDVNDRGVTLVPKEKESITIAKDTSITSVKPTINTSNNPVKISFEQNCGGKSFDVSGLLINIEKREIKMITKKKKAHEATTQRVSPTPSERSQSLPGSKACSPDRKLPKSAPTSRHTSPKKTQCESCQVKQQSNFKERKSQCTQVSINSSTESSQYNSTSDTVNEKSLNTFQGTAAKRILNKLPDTSDASTTYASPPSASAGAFLDAMNSSTPVLELLDSSPNETIKRKGALVSPVSSPETPSPRTMNLPSNIPRLGRVNKSLRFTSLISTQAKTGSNGISRGTRITSSFSNKNSVLSRLANHAQKCTCKNPGCKLVHDSLVDARNYTLKHCPQIMKKYEDLQNVCTERIASLDDLIKKVRDEQKGLELSVVTNDDSNSASQTIPNSQTSANGDMNKLMKNIETMHSQLRKTLIESQKIITGKGIKIVKLPSTENSPSLSESSKNTRISESLEENTDKEKYTEVIAPDHADKPKILSNERVNIPLERYTRTRSTNVPETNAIQASTMSKEESKDAMETTSLQKNEDMVVKLSNEILEQSKSINNSTPLSSLKHTDDPYLKSTQVPTSDGGETNKNDAIHDDNNQSANLETSLSDFVPLLAGIPKIPRSLGKNSNSNGRGRPPVTLISGPYRQDYVSPVHELSTIVEFDTPDTVNKSQVSTRSPSNKCRKKLPVSDSVQPLTSSPSNIPVAKSTKSKPSVHVAPLPAHRSPQRSLNVSNKSTSKNSEKSPRKSIGKSLLSSDMKSMSKSETMKNSSFDSLLTLPDVHIEELQQSQDNGDANNFLRVSQYSELLSLPDENIDQLIVSEICEESKSKSMTPKSNEKQMDHEDKGHVTSGSSISISGVSGISEISASPSTDINGFKCPSSPEEMEIALKKWGLPWAITTLKKTREASALGSSSSSDVTPVPARHVSPAKKHHDGTSHEFHEISDVSSISIKHANKSTERSVLAKGRTSTPNRMSNTNSDGTVSTLGSFSSDFNIHIPDQSAEITTPNIVFD